MEMTLYHSIKHELSIVEFKRGYIKINATNSQKHNKQELLDKLKSATEIDWIIESEDSENGVNYGEEESKKIQIKNEQIKNHELVQEVLKSFSGIEINDIKLKNN